MMNASNDLGGNAKPQRNPKGFTLIELLLSMGVLAILLLIITSVISETQRTWTRTASRATRFKEARSAFDLIIKSLSQATLNTYWDYMRTNPNDPVEAPSRYKRQSELRFVTGDAQTMLATGGKYSGHAVLFQSTIGGSDDVQYHKLDNLLASRGYFVQYGSDAPFRPAFLASSSSIPERMRYRLMEFSPPPENNMVYANSATWVADAANSPHVRPVAENILAIIIRPKVAPKNIPAGQTATYIAPKYAYDSFQTGVIVGADEQGTQHLLPPLLDVTLVALDEGAARRLSETGDSGNFLDDAGVSLDTAITYEEDIAALEQRLIDARVEYRVFSTTVALKTARWSL